MDERLKSLQEAILAIDEASAVEVTELLLKAEVPPQEILEEGMTAALLVLVEKKYTVI